MVLFSKKSGKKAKRSKKGVKKRISRDMRLRQMRRRKIILSLSFLSLFLIIVGVGHYTGSFLRFNNWLKSEVLKITTDAGFKVDEILVTGRVEISTEDILSKLTIKRDMPIFGLDIKEAQKSLSDIFWVKEVSISRRLPNIVFVELKERTPAALWQRHNKIHLIDDDGVILSIDNLKKWKNLPLIVGKGSREKVAELSFLLKAEPVIAREIVSATRVGDRRWDFKLKSGILVKLPEKDVEFALRRLVTLEEEKGIFNKNISLIDLRQPEKMVVRLVRSGNNVPLKRNKKIGRGIDAKK